MIPHRKGIERQAEHISSRQEIGHREVDTAVSRKSKNAIMVLQERKSGIIYLLRDCLAVPLQK